MKKNNKNNHSWRKICEIIFSILIAGFIIWYIASWYNVKKEEKLINSYLITTNTLSLEVKNLDEVVQVLKESPSEYFVYISYTNDESVYKLEKKLKSVIDNYNLKDEFYYINITNEKDSDNLYGKLNNIFNTKDIEMIPTILYYKDNELKSIITDKNPVNIAGKLKSVLKEDGFDYKK